jgi:hypothetical protein
VEIQSANAGLIRKLASSGERQSESAAARIDPHYEAGFHKPITSMIPLLIEQLKDKNWTVRMATTGLISYLAGRGEWELKGIAAQLTWDAKSSSETPS